MVFKLSILILDTSIDNGAAVPEQLQWPGGGILSL